MSTQMDKVNWMLVDTVRSIEAVGCHPFLTQAINFVHSAEKCLRDYEDCGGKPCVHDAHHYQFEGDLHCERCHATIPDPVANASDAPKP